MNFKTIKKTVALLFGCVLMISVFSCTEDDIFRAGEDNEVKFSEYGLDWEEKGALVIVKDVKTGFYDFQQKETATIGFTVDDFGADATAINVYRSYDGGTPILHTTLTSFPSDVNVSLAEAVEGFTDLDGVELLDQVVFTFDIATADGDFPSGERLAIDVSCVSDLAGDYMATTTGNSTDGCCPGAVTTEKVVTLTARGGGEYLITDWSANIYFVWYGPDGGNYGIDENYVNGGGMNAVIKDVCDDISADFTEPFGSGLTLSGSVDPDTGVITYSWENGFGDTATVVLTPM